MQQQQIIKGKLIDQTLTVWVHMDRLLSFCQALPITQNSTLQ